MENKRGGTSISSRMSNRGRVHSHLVTGVVRGRWRGLLRILFVGESNVRHRTVMVGGWREGKDHKRGKGPVCVLPSSYS